MNIRHLNFYKTESLEWYVNLPEWKGDIAELQMVAGADVMLDIYAQGENIIRLTLSDSNIGDNFDKLTLISDDLEAGATYKVNSILGITYEFEIWLCDVTKFVFGKFPKIIYIKK